jgi:hypothetical protein
MSHQIEDEDPDEVSQPSPVIIQLNSMNGAERHQRKRVSQSIIAVFSLARLAGTHANVEAVLRDYLAREWAARRQQPLERGVALFGPSGESHLCT